MNWYQVVAIILLTTPAVAHAMKHGEHIPGKYNFWGKCIGISLWVFVLYSGGFWS